MKKNNIIKNIHKLKEFWKDFLSGNNYEKICFCDNEEIFENQWLDIESRYNEEHRKFHNFSHIINILNHHLKYSKETQMIIAIMYHDIFYDPMKNENEYNSNLIFINHYNKWLDNIKTRNIYENVSEIIINSGKSIRERVGSSKDNSFFHIDANILLHGSMVELLQYEKQIFEEYQYVRYDEYTKERVKFLKEVYDIYKSDNIKELILYVENRKPKIGLYAGSFNPFHIGHLDVLRKAEKIFDKVY